MKSDINLGKKESGKTISSEQLKYAENHFPISWLGVDRGDDGIRCKMLDLEFVG
jgi:hypothetical protein